MALFTPSTLPWVSAVQQVADSAGASADNEMTQRAHLSLRAAFQYFNGKAKWNYLRAEAAPVNLVSPFAVTGVSASAGQVSAACPAGHGFQVEDYLSGSGIIAGNRVSATAAGGIGLYAPITGFSAGVAVITATAIRDSYDLPSDWRATYSVKLLGAQKALRYVGRRLYDRLSTLDTITGTPDLYDLYNSMGRGKIRLLDAPQTVDVMVHRYQRRMFIASASSISTTAIDIPEDYESFPIAWAKWHFLTDKQETRGQQATTWLSLAQEGLRTMLSDQNAIPDEDLVFTPGYATLSVRGGDNSTRYVDWNT